MTGKEIAIAALELKPTPRPAATLVAGGEWCVNHAGETFKHISQDPAAAARVFIKAHQDLKQDLLWTGAGLLNYPAHALGCAIVEEGSASPALSGPAAPGLEEALDLDFEKALAHPTVNTVMEHGKLVADAIGHETCIMPTAWGPFTTAARLVGAEELMLGTVTDPELLEELLEKTTDFFWAIARQAMDHPLVAGLNISEPVASPDMIGPDSFQRFVAPCLEKIIQRAREMGKYSMLHICGDSTALLEKVAELKPHAFSLESKVDLTKAREVLGGKVCVVGNVSPTGAFLKGSPQEVTQEAKACLSAWGPNPGFILSQGCDFPRQAPMENLLALLNAARE